MTNKYITHGIRQDVENDQNITYTLRSKLVEAITEAEKLRDVRALAFYEETIPAYIEALDKVITDIVTPLEQKLTEGEEYHANEGNDTRAVS